jgi:uncharacterized protein (UPF0261 family)
MPQPLVAISVGPLTRPCAEEVARLLTERGRPARPYVADGAGGRALEADVHAGRVAAVLDLTLTELAAELAGFPGGAGPDRLTAAALRGVPQVIVLGGLDAVAVQASRKRKRPEDRRTAEFEGVRYVRTTPEENDMLGREIAHKASAARGPTAVMVPRGGLSALDAPGRPFWWPDADGALVQSVCNWISPHVRLRELDLHVNDPAFAAAAVGIVAEHLAGAAND